MTKEELDRLEIAESNASKAINKADAMIHVFAKMFAEIDVKSRIANPAEFGNELKKKINEIEQKINEQINK